MQIKKIFSVFLLTIFLVLPSNVDAEEIVIYHTNDFHTRILNTDDKNKTISFAEISAFVKHNRKLNKNTLWLDAGDTFHGLPQINLSRGESMVKLLNVAGIDALTPGNHDFDYSAKRLVELSETANFPFLAANLFWKDNGERIFSAYKIFTLENGLKIGVFGLTTSEVMATAKPDYVDNIVFLDAIEKTREVIKAIKPECDIIVGLMHIGIKPNSLIKSTDIANAAPGIDIIIDGHSHTELPGGIMENGTLIAQTGYWGHNLGKVTINYENKTIVSKKAELINKADFSKIFIADSKEDNSKKTKAYLKPDEAVIKTLNEIDAKNAVILNQEVCKMQKSVPFEYSLIRRQETELGDLIADSFIWRTGADVALINSGGICAGLNNIVKMGDLLSIFPFGNALQVKKIKGKDLRIALNHAVQFYPHTAGSFLQVSGLSFEFYPTLPVGERVSNVMVKNAPLDDNAFYSVASADFLFNGGDGYRMLVDGKVEKEYGTLEEVLMKYLSETKDLNVKMNRIKRLKDVPIPDEKAIKQLEKQEKKAA